MPTKALLIAGDECKPGQWALFEPWTKQVHLYDTRGEAEGAVMANTPAVLFQVAEVYPAGRPEPVELRTCQGERLTPAQLAALASMLPAPPTHTSFDDDEGLRVPLVYDRPDSGCVTVTHKRIPLAHDGRP